MIAAIFIVPLIYFFNAFFIGRLIKKWRINVNPFLASIIGFIAFFDVIYIISIWMYAGRAAVWSYFLIVGIIQVVLLAFYIANWRYTFITWSVDYKKIIIFFATFALIILIGWLNFREYNSEFGRNWIWTIEHSQLNIWQPMWFGVNSNDVVSNFSAFNVMNMFWFDAFSIIAKNEALTFCNWSWTIITAGFVACLAVWMYNKTYTIPRIIISIVLLLGFCVLTLAFIETYAIGDAWILLLLLTYILVMVKVEGSRNLKLFMLTTLLIGFLAASCTSFFTVICVWIFSIYYVIRNKQNSLNFAIFLSWPLFLTVFSLLSVFTFWLLSLIDAVYLIFAIILIIVFTRRGAPAWETRIATAVYRNSGRIVYTGLAILIALILIANFFVFQEIYHWDGKNIDYRNFLTFTYTYLWSINITSNVAIAIFNAVMYAVFVAITITYLVIRKLKSNKLNPLFKKDSAIKFGVVSCILFINPLVIHVLKSITVSFPLNTLDLNMLFVVPLFVISLKANANSKYVPIQNWEYNWY